ncbi:mandelate racemase/muconate lactonizing enzyme family protein [Lutimonas saemankumensis]|uniref:mandelate racemase/muconate lactonizing enzyme family protein n=1 Tax=Lutimonas saemankumensis TaxID=483016 RepID=UPI001CD4F03E|nr:mandelate racemase/muconate lactonizing enzyme family protein [Lutimonas saemankumensis]MCA0932503.1 mandelate racemase/muconate lactonizing enzyme family protein [Lutimonas saemankumensis]
MIIEKVETFVLKDKLSKSFFFSQWEYSERSICVVKITASDGTYGWGEGYGPAKILEEGVNFLKPIVIGSDPLKNELVWHQMYRKTLDYARRGILVSSMSAIDIAIWDLKGKILGVAVSALLGGAHRDKVKPYATGLYFRNYEEPSVEFGEEIERYVKQGFKAIKMKVGLGVDEDYENVKKVRSMIGDEIELMIDSNHAYSLKEAVSLARKLEPLNISWFEEPLSPEFYDQYRELREKTTIPIAAGECEYLRYGFHQLLRSKSVDILQPDICSSGGLTEAKRISTLASVYGIDVIPHTWGTSIGMHVALHFISNLELIPGRMKQPDFLMEYDQTENALREKLTFPKVIMKDGFIKVPKGPGLGLDVNEDVLREYDISKMKDKSII